MVRDLNVWFFGECVGVLTQNMGELTFRYLPMWLESKNAQPLSQSLPLVAEPFEDKIARPFLLDYYQREINVQRWQKF